MCVLDLQQILQVSKGIYTRERSEAAVLVIDISSFDISLIYP